MLRIDLERCLCRGKTVILYLLMVVILLLSVWENVAQAVQGNVYGNVTDLLMTQLLIDRYKVLLAFLLAGLYTGSYCRDENTKYLRFLLARTDVVSYTLSRFLVNTMSILLMSVAVFYSFTGIMCLLGFPLETAMPQALYYTEVAKGHPLLYIGMMGIQFGMVCAACGSVGLLFSAYHPDAFISIGICGMVFFCAVSFLPLGTIFNVYGLVGMQPTLPRGWETPQPVMALWGMLYPTAVSGLCAAGFYRQLNRRRDNAFI